MEHASGTGLKSPMTWEQTQGIGMFDISHEDAWEFLQKFVKTSISTPNDLAMLRRVAPVVCNVVREGGEVMTVIMPILHH